MYPFLPSLIARWATGRLQTKRGMSFWRDVIDWVGGLPFEVATPEAVVDYCQLRGFRLTRLVTTQRNGCNEFVFVRGARRAGDESIEAGAISHQGAHTRTLDTGRARG